MNNITLTSLITLAILLGLGGQTLSAQTAQQPDNSIHYSVNPQVVQSPQRLGINLGSWTSYGAEQFMRNVIQNPGFEGYVDRYIVFVSAKDQTSFSDQPGWGLPDNYWNGATYLVRSGAAINATGTISRYVQNGANGAPQYFLNGAVPNLTTNDMIVVYKTVSSDPVPIWYISGDDLNHLHVDKSTVRPGTRGTQSLRMDPVSGGTTGFYYYLDAISSRAGVLLPVTGNWSLSIWAKAAQDGDTVTVAFQRLNGSAPFLQQSFQPTTTWQQYVFNFTGVDPGPPATLQLSVRGTGTSSVWFDDVSLGQSQIGTSAFRKEVVDALNLLRPSYIRDSGPLGDSFQNRIASISQRQVWMFHTSGGNPSPTFSFSIPDHIALSASVGANPWIIVPVTWSDAEYVQLGQYLAQAITANKFKNIIVEFGNENWNWVFRPLAIPYPDVHGAVADRAFQSIMQGAGANTPIIKYINGQDASPGLTSQFIAGTQQAQAVATAPYFFYELDPGESIQQVMTSLFATDQFVPTNAQNAKSAGKTIGIYEVNMHNTIGSMANPERNSYVAGLAAGSALAQNLINLILNGYNPILVSNLTQYDMYLGQIQDYVKLWGVMRDILTTKRFRPTGLAMLLLNNIIGGNAYGLTLSTTARAADAASLTMVAFQWKTQWTAAVTNSNANPLQVTIDFPDDSNTLPTTILYLKGSGPTATNEDSQQVTISSLKPQINNRAVMFTIPAYGFVILTSGTPSP